MRLIILAAGRGSRMGDLTADRPKGLLEVGGQALVNRILMSASEVGITDATIVAGYLSKCYENMSTRMVINEKWQSTNMVFSLLQAASDLEASDCLISYSDIFYEANDLDRLSKTEGDFIVGYDPNWLEKWELRFDDVFEDAEKFIHKGNDLLEIGGRLSDLSQATGQYVGLIKVTRQGWMSIASLLKQLSKERLYQLDMTSLISLVIKNGVCKVSVLPIKGICGEVDSVKDLDIARTALS